MFTNLIKHGLYMVDTYVVSFIGNDSKMCGQYLSNRGESQCMLRACRDFNNSLPIQILNLHRF